MKSVKLSALLVILSCLAMGHVVAQTSPGEKAGSTVAQSQAKFSSDSLVGDLLDNAQAKAVLIKHFPELAGDDRIEQARAMTLRSLQQFSPDTFTDAVLVAIDSDLAKVPADASVKH